MSRACSGLSPSQHERGLRKKDIRVDGVHTSLEAIVKSSLASTAGKDLCLDDQFICACK